MWCCPRCRAPLKTRDECLVCDGCGSRYETVAGIPDLRAEPIEGIDYAKDREQARALAAQCEGQPVEAVIALAFSDPIRTRELAELRIRQVLEAPQRLRRDLRGWLAPATAGGGRFVDLGCGPGMLLAAAAAEGRAGIGIDVLMPWLVVARHVVRSYGGEPLLAAAIGEALPLADRSVSGVVSLDVLEHVQGLERYFSEIDRVLAPGGHAALTTPNRYSLTAEPHVKVWGVGLLPRPWQKPYAVWRAGVPYESTALRSLFELRRLLRASTTLDFDIVLGDVAKEEIAKYPGWRALAARIYNSVIASTLGALLKPIAPYFRILARRPG